MTTQSTAHHPSSRKLLVSTCLAALVALAVLLVAVLPAEYGRDPTGLGAALGLTALHTEEEGDAFAPVTPRQSEVADRVDVPAVLAADMPYATQSRSLVLQPGEGAEIKAVMQTGESFVFNWEATGPVHVDMHGEPPDAGDTFESYWRDRSQTQASGHFIAPFAGTHGWYWQNASGEPVTVTVSLSGFFERVYQP